jgi:hypothetical protein
MQCVRTHRRTQAGSWGENNMVRVAGSNHLAWIGERVQEEKGCR